MKQKQFWMVSLLLFLPAVLRADPIAVNPYDAREAFPAVGALLVEVLAVLAILQGCQLRPIRFGAVWLAVNLFTFYLLLPAVIKLSNTFGLRIPADYFAGEFVVFLFEAAALLAVGRWGFVRGPFSENVSILRAVAASFAGNFISFSAYLVFGSFH